MSTIQISEDILPLGQFKIQASALLKSINSSNRSIIITQNGKPEAVVLSPSKFERLNTQSRFLSAVQQGLDDAQAGRVIDDDMLEWSWKIKLRSCKLRWSDRSTAHLANIYVDWANSFTILIEPYFRMNSLGGLT